MKRRDKENYKKMAIGGIIMLVAGMMLPNNLNPYEIGKKYINDKIKS